MFCVFVLFCLVLFCLGCFVLFCLFCFGNLKFYSNCNFNGVFCLFCFVRFSPLSPFAFRPFRPFRLLPWRKFGSQLSPSRTQPKRRSEHDLKQLVPSICCASVVLTCRWLSHPSCRIIFFFCRKCIEVFDVWKRSGRKHDFVKTRLGVLRSPSFLIYAKKNSQLQSNPRQHSRSGALHTTPTNYKRTPPTNLPATSTAP